jgi:hypothetical protein
VIAMSIAHQVTVIKARVNMILTILYTSDDQQSTMAGMSEGFFKGAHDFILIGAQFTEVIWFE